MSDDKTSGLYSHITELEGRLELESQRRNRAERRLLRLEKALDTMQIGVTITDADGKITYINPSDAQMHGYRPEELLGQKASVFSCANDRKPLQGHELGSVSSWQRESLNVRKDGSVFPVQLLSDAVVDRDGRPLGIVTTCQDITARKDAERELLDSRDALDEGLLVQARELAAANRQLQDEIAERERSDRKRQVLEDRLRQIAKLDAVGQLTGGIAHDFNNLLGVVTGNAELLDMSIPADADELHESVAEIRTAAKNGAKMIERLLGFSRRAELDLVATDLGQLVEDTVGMLRRVIRADIVISTDIHTGVPTTMVDSASAQQILLNLVTNARDAMPSGGTISIDVSSDEMVEAHRQSYPWLEPGPYVCIAVTDTGLGMDRETLEKVFEPFFTTKEQGNGTGLGLAMVYGLMKQHKGYVHVDSDLGRGTSVRLFFPVAVDATCQPSGSVPAVHVQRGSETILLAEDEENLRWTARRALESCGYTVLTASDGLEALDVYREHRGQIQLIFSDMVMPNMGGRDLYDELRRQGSDVRFLFASGYSSAEPSDRVRLAEAGPIIRKPWSLEELAGRVREALDAGVQYT